VPLVTSASLKDPIPGALGQPGTQVILGSHPLEEGLHNGGRFWAGCRLDEEGVWGLDGGYLFLGARQVHQAVATSGLPGSLNPAVPFFDVSGVAGLKGIPGESIFILPGPFPGALVGAPGTTVPGFQGLFQLALTSRLQGAEANGLVLLGQGDRLRLDGLFGFRWLELAEGLSFSGQTAGLPGSLFAGGFYDVLDQFRTRNDFYGGQLGFRLRYQAWKLSLEASAKVALGDVHEAADVNGASVTNSGSLFLTTKGTGGQVLPGGIFTQPSNLGNYGRDGVAVVPEAAADLGYQVLHNVRLSVGYTFLFVSEVVRPGDQIDRNINVTRTSLADASRQTVGIGGGPIAFGAPGAAPAAFGPVAPLFPFNTSTFWAQGIRLGLVIQF
jgi:hypothetical protein